MKKTNAVSLTHDVCGDGCDDDPCKQMRDEETRREIRKAMQFLNPELLLIITLYYYNDLQMKDIAQLLGIPLGTVKSRLFRAKRQLREFIEDDTQVKEVGPRGKPLREVYS